MIIHCQSKEDDEALETILEIIKIMYPSIEVSGTLQEACVISDCWGIQDLEDNLSQAEDDLETYELWSSLSTAEKISVLFRLERSIYSDDFYSESFSSLLECAPQHIQAVIRERKGEAV